VKIAVDAMGGDRAPAQVVGGVCLAARDLDVEIILVGDEPEIRRHLRETMADVPSSISIRHASQQVEMHDPPSSVVRRKRDSSIWIATELVRNKEAAAVISAGNTGATMVSAFFLLGVLKGIDRPAIAVTLPTLRGQAIMLDVGATVDSLPHQLYQFAIMGNEYAKQVLGDAKPKIGLLSIGEEDEKGNETTREAFSLLKNSSLNFIGNVEGRDVYTGMADVIVCDGFIGNVGLKISEGVVEIMTKMLINDISHSRIGKLGYALLRPSLHRFKKRIDYAEFGGAPLLGVNGTCVICHGRSSAKAVYSAVRLARQLIDQKINESIQDDVVHEAAFVSANDSTRASG
tara:strand:- start:10776 stop:11810 length:1035 start_codon:yes stop_codon:yes gene_type:complete